MELLLRDIGLDYIPNRAVRVEKYCMRGGLYLGLNTSVQQFVEWFNDLKRYLLYFREP
jgi:hypothetical protein